MLTDFDTDIDTTPAAPGTILTADQIWVEGIYHGLGVTACGDDGEPLAVIGTHDLTLAEQALASYLQEIVGTTLHDYFFLCRPGCHVITCRGRGGCQTTASITSREWWLFRAEPDYGWDCHLVDAYTPGAIPVVTAA